MSATVDRRPDFIEQAWIALLAALTQHRQSPDEQSQDIRALLRASGLPNHSSIGTGRDRNAEYKRQWEEEILPYRVNRNTDGLLRAFAWRNGRSLEQVLSPERAWNSWSYRASYPKLSAFLAQASLSEKSKSQVLAEDFGEDGSVAKWESTGGILDHASLWEALRSRCFARSEDTADVADVNEPGAPSRMLRVVDLSPVVASLLLGSTPKVNLYSIAPFFERYLGFSNWGKASLFGIRSNERANAFTFEYHFAFYFVPKSPMDISLAMKDFRGVRKMAPFGPFSESGGRPDGDPTSSRYIYEEQLSFILIGQGSDVYTCYQLAEKYFIGPYVTGAGRGSVFVHPGLKGGAAWTPSAIFLSWIMLALHHVRWRWQSAIEAVDAQIDSPSQIIFGGNNDHRPDLLSDDSQFSRSKTYFWALQAYKMFEEKLGETISCWADFRQTGLGKLHDGRMADEDWLSTTRSIDKAIEMLTEKLEWVQRKSAEVRNLRDGLIGASSLFDSRTTVRQGDNIRLLTYVTLLFLPLSFCTSIFGMQTILPSLPVKAFAITMPVVTLSTAILVFNLQNLLDIWERISQEITLRMRSFMRRHPRGHWQTRAQALQEDKRAHQPPIRKQQRQSTHWIYALFFIDAILISIPVHELSWLCRSGRLILSHSRQSPVTDGSVESEYAPKDSVGERSPDVSRAKRVKFVAESEKTKGFRSASRRAQIAPRIRLLARLLGQVLVVAIRILLLPLWTGLLVLEYFVLLFYFAFFPYVFLMNVSGESRDSDASQPARGAAPSDTSHVSRPSIRPAFYMLPVIFLGLAPISYSPPSSAFSTTVSKTSSTDQGQTAEMESTSKTRTADTDTPGTFKIRSVAPATFEAISNMEDKWTRKKWRKAQRQQASGLADIESEPV